MFKDVYKAANDDIKASDELLEAVLLGKRKRRVPPVLKYSSVAAACAAVAVCLAVSPSVVEKDDSVSTPAFTTAPKTENSSFETAKHADTASEIGSQAIPFAKNAPSEENKQEQPSVKSAAKAEAVSEPVNESGVTKTRDMAELSASMPETAEEKVNTYIKTVVLHVNSYDYGGSYMDEGGYDEAVVSGSAYTTVDWTMDDYFAYLGENVFDKISLPPDFLYIGDMEMTVSLDENGIPAQDSRIFPYEGENGRYVSVITSKDTLTSRSYLEDTRYVKSDIEGNDAVVIGGGEEYKSYMISNDVSHIITSDGVTEDELADMLVSIGG